VSNEFFAVIRAQRDGLPAVLAVNLSLRTHPQPDSQPWRMALRLPLAEVNDAGICSDSESARLDNVEDELLADLDPQTYAYAGRITWNGVRTVLTYTADPGQWVAAVTPAIVRSGGQAEIDLRFDPEWEEYHTLLPPEEND
jgi:hypothetical protein